jgi:hypothetical protein
MGIDIADNGDKSWLHVISVKREKPLAEKFATRHGGQKNGRDAYDNLTQMPPGGP